MHIDRIEFICYFSFAEKTNAMLFLTQRIFFVTAMTQLSHTLTPSFSSSIYFAHSHHRCSALAQSALELQTLGNEVPMLYTSLIYLHKTFTFETRSVCAYAARTQAHFNFLTSSEYYHFMPMHGVQKRGAWGRRHKLFFAFFY